MRANVRCGLAVLTGILVGYFFLQVLRSFSFMAEARGACSGIAGYMAGSLIAAPRHRRRR